MRAIWSLLACVLLVAAGRADDVRPAYLEIREAASGSFNVTWKTPMRGRARLRITPRFPEGFRALSGSYEQTVLSDSLIERWRLESDHASLAGREVRIDGLEMTNRDVVVRVRFADGRSHAVLVRATHPSFVVPEDPGASGQTLLRGLSTAVLDGVRHSIAPVHLLFAAALGLALGGRAVGLMFVVFLGSHVLGVAAGRTTGMTLAPALGDAGLALAGVFAAREAVLGSARRVAEIAAIASFAHGVSVAGDQGASFVELVAMTIGIDAMQVSVCVASVGLVWLVRAGRVVLAYVAGTAATVVALVSVLSPAGAQAAPSPSGLPATMAAERSLPPAGRSTQTSQAPTASVPMRAFVDITPFETRVEILARLDVLARWLAIEVPADTVAIAEQASLLEAAAKRLRQRLSVRIDSETRAPVVMRKGFAVVDVTGTTLRREPVVESAMDAFVGIAYAIATKSVPRDVSVAIAQWPEGVSEISGKTSDPESTRDVVVTAAQPVLRWRNQLREDPLPPVDAVVVRAPTLEVPILALAVVAAVVVLLRFAVRKNRAARGVTARLAMAGALAIGPVWTVGLPVPLGLASVPGTPEARAIARSLLENVYRAFDYRDEETIYDRLAVGVSGEQLTKIYLEHRRGLEVEKAGGAQARVEAVEVTAVRDIQPATGDGFRAEVEWAIAGSVTHFGHRHVRQNRYLAELEIAPEHGAWKLRDVDLREEERVR